MNAVRVRDEDRRSEDDEEDVASDEVSGEEAHLNELDDKLAHRLAHRSVGTKRPVVPNTRPPGAVRLIVLELAREEDRNEDLEERPLDGDDREHAEEGVRGLPRLEEPLEGGRGGSSASERWKGAAKRTHEKLKEADHSNDSSSVGDGSHDGSELGAAVVQHRSEAERDEEENDEERHVPDDGSEGDDRKADETRDLGYAGLGKAVGE